MNLDELIAEVDNLRCRIAELEDIRVRLTEAQQALRESEERFRHLYEDAPFGYQSLDEEGRVLEVNAACLETLGYSREQLVGRSFEDFLTPACGETFRENRPKFMVRGKMHGIQVDMVRNDRSIVSVVLYGHVSSEQSGLFKLTVCMMPTFTELKTSRRELKENEERLLMALDGANLGMWDWDLTIGKAFWAERTHRMLGYEANEFEPSIKNWKRLVHPDDWPKVSENLNLHIEGKVPRFEAEYRIRDKSGNWRWTQAKGSVVEHDESQKPIRMTGVIIDITDRKKAEAALAEGEHRYRTLVEDSFDGIFLQKGTKIVFANKPLHEMLGYEPGELIGKDHWIIYHPEDQPMTRARAQARLRGESVIDHYEVRLQSKEGSVLYGEIRAKAFSFEEEPVIQVWVRDISELKRSKEELLRSNRSLRTLSECNRALVRAQDETTFVNDICRILVETGNYHMAWIGFAEQDEAKSVRPVAQFGFEDGYLNTANITWADAERGRGPTGTAIRTGQPVIARNIPTDLAYDPWREGAVQRGYTSSAALPLKRDDRIFGALNVYATEPDAFDAEEVKLLRELADDLAYGITALRMRSEREWAEAEKQAAEASDRLKSAFLATMSHELRTPLNSIIGFTGIILQGLAGPLNAEQTKQLEMVRSSARHLLALINDVLDISKIEAGQLEVASERFDLRASIDKVLGIVAPLAEKKGLALRADVVTEIGEAVGDQRRVEQILLNLLNNAIKFTDSGEVGLRTELDSDFKLSGATSGQSAVRFRVSDTGIGIKPDDLTTLFQPFRQIESGLSRNYEGTGLGLAICRRLADLMGGEISAESVWEKGSTFCFTLPLKGSSQS